MISRCGDLTAVTTIQIALHYQYQLNNVVKKMTAWSLKPLIVHVIVFLSCAHKPCQVSSGHAGSCSLGQVYFIGNLALNLWKDKIALPSYLQMCGTFFSFYLFIDFWFIQ